MKIQGGVRFGVRVDVNGEVKFVSKFKKKYFFWGGGVGRGRSGAGGGGKEKKKLCSERDLNPRPSDYKSCT